MKISTWHLRGAVGALSLVVIGALFGVVADRVWLAHGHAPRAMTVAPAGGPGHAAVMAFREVLELDDDQIGAIHEILMRNQVQIDDAWQSIRVEMNDGVENAHAEIRRLLTDEQLELFEAWLDRHVRGSPNEDGTLLWAH